MRIQTVRFGEVTIDEQKIITFAAGLPGLEAYSRFAVLQFDESYPITWLQCVDEPSICLPVVDSFLVMPDYAFNLADEDVKELELRGPEDLQVLSVMVIPDNIEQMTVNQVAPVVINMRTGAARQIILNGGDFNARLPIFEELIKRIKEGRADAGAVAQAE
ncbi:MAG: flagellar assembly protein FliW [Clostridiales bacterium]|nr:flagellar assembly protein FliW [Clostridiales bacterium]